MNLIRHIVVLCLLVLGLSGCGDNNQSPTEALALWERINSEDYRSFSRAPGYETTQPSFAPHGNSVDIYVSRKNFVSAAKIEPYAITLELTQELCTWQKVDQSDKDIS